MCISECRGAPPRRTDGSRSTFTSATEWGGATGGRRHPQEADAWPNGLRATRTAPGVALPARACRTIVTGLAGRRGVPWPNASGGCAHEVECHDRYRYVAHGRPVPATTG